MCPGRHSHSGIHLTPCILPPTHRGGAPVGPAVPVLAEAVGAAGAAVLIAATGDALLAHIDPTAATLRLLRDRLPPMPGLLRRQCRWHGPVPLCATHPPNIWLVSRSPLSGQFLVRISPKRELGLMGTGIWMWKSYAHTEAGKYGREGY